MLVYPHLGEVAAAYFHRERNQVLLARVAYCHKAGNVPSPPIDNGQNGA